MIYGLYQKTDCGYYEDGSSTYTTLLHAATDFRDLKYEWNQKRRQEKDKLDQEKAHASHYIRLYPSFEKIDDIDEVLQFNGNTGGGCSYVYHKVFIKEIENKI